MVLHNAIGAIFIGSLLSTTLFGVSCAQVYYYFGHYKKDPWYLRLLVLTIWVSDFVHQALISHTTYTYAITNYGNVAILGNLIRTLLVQFLFTGFTALMVQSFFTFRMWQASNKNHVLTGIMLAMVVGGFVTTIIYAAQGLRMETFGQLDAWRHLILVANVFSAIPNLYITGASCWLVHHRRSQTRALDSLSSNMFITSVIFCLETGLPFTILSVIMMITGIALRDSMVYISFLFILSRLYLNCMLFVLNGRKSLRGPTSTQTEKDGGISRRGGGGGALQLPSHGRWLRDDATQRTQGNIAIRIDTVQEFAGDTGSPVDDPYKTSSFHSQEVHELHA